MSDRFHRAARDGYLTALKEATKRDCNHGDEDGVTPTAYAAHGGNLEALRVLVGRGGDPEKWDHYGKTSLHAAAAKGHMNCVSFLVNFGVNVWAKDNEFHSAQDLAAIYNKEEILRYLDLEAARQEKEDPKRAKRLQEKETKEAEKRQKEYDKIQRKADKKRQEEEDKLQKEREKINNLENANTVPQKKGIFNTISKNSFGLITLNKSSEPKALHSKSIHSPTKFSELTDHNSHSKKTATGIQKKIMKKKVVDEDKNTNGFKVRATETDGQKSIRNLSGLQRDSEIIFVPNGSMSSTESESSPAFGRRGKISDVFQTENDSLVGLSSGRREADFDEPRFGSHQRVSIFDRPGFGAVAFRSSLTATLGTLHPSTPSGPSSAESGDTSLDSHGSPKQTRLAPWIEEDLPSDDDDSTPGPSPVYVFLSTNGLVEYLPLFTRNQVDLEALMLLTEQDLEALNIPLGPRRKLLKALNGRRLAEEEEEERLQGRGGEQVVIIKL